MIFLLMITKKGFCGNRNTGTNILIVLCYHWQVLAKNLRWMDILYTELGEGVAYSLIFLGLLLVTLLISLIVSLFINPQASHSKLNIALDCSCKFLERTDWSIVYYYPLFFRWTGRLSYCVTIHLPTHLLLHLNEFSLWF